MNWYAYKVLADGYAADRQRVAEVHRQARTEARRAGAAGPRPATPGTGTAGCAHPSRIGHRGQVLDHVRGEPDDAIALELRLVLPG